MAGDTIAELVLVLPPSLNAPAASRMAMTSLEPFIGQSCVEVAQLLMSELVTNTLRHAGISDHDRIETRARVTADTLYLEVTDDGVGFDAPPPGLSPSPSPSEESGLGLVLLDRLTVRWGVSREDGTRVWGEVAL